MQKSIVDTTLGIEVPENSRILFINFIHSKFLNMPLSDDSNIDPEIISKLGLVPSDKHINSSIAPNARVFEYPLLENVFIMECDLYGNEMPKGSCFLVFQGNHGLIGKHLTNEALKNASLEDIKSMVQVNLES